jgi:aconitate hydratase
MAAKSNSLGAQAVLSSRAGNHRIHRLDALLRHGVTGLDRLPLSIRILLESALRNLDEFEVRTQDVMALARWSPGAAAAREVPFKVARVILQDFTGVPAVVDLAAMRSAMKRAGGDPARINPLVPVDLVIDHSVQVDAFGNPQAPAINAQNEFARNRERYEFLKWGQQALANFRVVPPETGIVHQVNLEYLAKVVWTRDGEAYPDTLVGTDSHTTMINGLGVVGWGVGGIEAEACMLGQPIYMAMPQVVGFELTGQLPPGSTATDLVLVVTQMLRAHGVVDKFVEFFGEALDHMTVADRATLANMAPEYGATMGLFPIDAQTLDYLRLTGRDPAHLDLVERYCKEQGLWRQKSVAPVFDQTLRLDLASVKPSVAGPRRPQDRVELSQVSRSLHAAFANLPTREAATPDAESLTHGSVAIAAITSCTNTSNPSVMLAAGLLARKAVERGLRVPSFVKTSLAPGSRVVTDYLHRAGLDRFLDQLGFNTVGYGCTTCIGNSGPLPQPVARAVEEGELVVAAVLSGNRNFEGRINPLVKASYLASPPLVVAYALAGTVDIDLTSQPLGRDASGQDVFLRDLWPSEEQVNQVLASCLDAEMFRSQYANVEAGNPRWNQIAVRGGQLYQWDASSTYVQEPPFFMDLSAQPAALTPIAGARVLAMLGDSVTTDHISPAGSIKKDSPAGRFLMEHGVAVADFNSYGARRGDWRVMMRGTFANVRLRNLLSPGTEGPWTNHQPDGRLMSIYDAAVQYRADGVPLVVLAGKDYGMGSSRDWAAKGTFLLGVRAVIAESFERIHRSNLVGMGVLPLVYRPGENRSTLGLMGAERFDILGIDDRLKPGQELRVVATGADGSRKEFAAICRIDTPVEIDYYRHGGILHRVLRGLLG